MRALGIETLLHDEHQAPIIVTFRQPADPRFDFEAFYDALLRAQTPEKQGVLETRTSPTRRALETLETAGGDVFAMSSRGDDSVANLTRVLETL